MYCLTAKLAAFSPSVACSVKVYAPAVVGVPLATKPGSHSVDVYSASGKRAVPFQVTDKQYRTQKLTIKNQRQVDPNPDDLKRINSEQERSNAALSKFTVTDAPSLILLSPVEGVRSDSYGSRRIFNGQPRNPHSGMDIAAPTGTPSLTSTSRSCSCSPVR